MDGFRLAARILGTMAIPLGVAGLWMVTAGASGADPGTPSCVPFWPCDPSVGPGGIVAAGAWLLGLAVAAGVAAGLLGAHARKRARARQGPPAPQT